EHPVTEQVTGIDLVREQLRVAAGKPLSFAAAPTLWGHAIECRINAEDPEQGFRPVPGTITRWAAPSGDPDVRVDTHVCSGYVIPPHYDSLLCKVITRGRDRDDACDRMIRALGELVCEGVPTTIPMHLAILRSRAFREHRYDTRKIPGFAEQGRAH
ncbi:MAG: acetyl-CoA carboxylase biotin carboxylase subunit, partial [Myxococcales bacterium]|nr:acetyl-CoA carboxylase biotin carboxylase subunit [Myxococcales bacterium]